MALQACGPEPLRYNQPVSVPFRIYPEGASNLSNIYIPKEQQSPLSRLISVAYFCVCGYIGHVYHLDQGSGGSLEFCLALVLGGLPRV